ncbi:MAG: DegV family protein, partial [Lachnospiraceae bacterium]
MRDFIITTDSTVDLPMDYLEKSGNRVLSLSYMIGDDTYEDMHGLSSKDFYEKVRKGSLPTTSQMNPQQAKVAFESILKEEKDILHIGFSSGLSGSCHSAKMASEELLEEYPEARIIVIDSLCASMGEGLLLYKLNEMKQWGNTIEEIAKWAEENKLHICHNFTVD